MADYIVSQFTMIDGRTVEIKDAVARAAIQGGTYFLGVTTTEVVDGSTNATVEINGEEVTAINGNMVAYQNKEFVYTTSDNQWHELGDLTNLGDLALKDSASGTYTPHGDAVFTGSTIASSGSYTPEGSVTFSGGAIQSSGSYTPQGTVTKPEVDMSVEYRTITELDSPGSVVNGVAASATLPTWGLTLNGENLVLSWDQGSFTPNVPTQVVLPDVETVSVITDVSADLHEAPIFTGTSSTIGVQGIVSGSVSFTGTPATIEVEGTTAGTVAFTGTEETITVS